jgi:TctA family transporter
MRRLLAELRDIAKASPGPHQHLRERLLAVGAVTLIVAVACGLLAFLFERHGSHTEIHTLWDGFFWASTQLLTVSSQMKNPVTTGGRILDLFMEAYAITVVASLAGSFGAFFHVRSRQRMRSSHQQEPSR